MMKPWIYSVAACLLVVAIWGVTRDNHGRGADPAHDAKAARSDFRSQAGHARRDRPANDSVGKKVSSEAGFLSLTEAEWLDDNRRQELVTDLIRWAEDHGREALEVLVHVPASVRDEVACALAGSMIQDQSELAWQILVGLPPSPVSQAMIQQLAMEYVEKSPEEALEWALGLEPEAGEESVNDREAVIAAVLTAYAGRDPEKAMGLVNGNLAKGPLFDKTTVEIIQRWTQSAPSAAASYVLAMPPGDVRDAAMENLVRIWAAEQPSDARKWVEGLGDPAVRTKVEAFLPGAADEASP